MLKILQCDLCMLNLDLVQCEFFVMYMNVGF